MGKEKDIEPCLDEELPTDILHDILIRLPVKTLSRLRCVCKQWCSLVSHPLFQQDYDGRHSRQDPLLLMSRCEYNEGNSIKTNTLHFSSYTNEGALINNFSKTGLQQCPYYPIQSCRGLVCFGAMYKVNPILVCNPSTEELIALPPTQGKHQCIGFGYATSTKEFKVVRFFIYPEWDEDENSEDQIEFPETEIRCQVFVLGTSEWREARSLPPQYPPNFFKQGAPFLHGALHLLECLPSNDDGVHPSVDVFDIETEEYTKKIPVPQYYYDVSHDFRRLYLKEFGGSLYLTFDFISSLEFWCLRDYDNMKWVKEFFIDLNPLGRLWVDPLLIMGDGSMMLSTGLKGDNSFCYNFEDQSYPKNTQKNCVGILYAQSFLPVGNRQ